MILNALGEEIALDVEVLRDNEIILTPCSVYEHKDYLLRLAGRDKYNKTPPDQLERGLEFVKYAWLGKSNGIIGGILFVCYLPNVRWWTLDAYKDNNLDNRLGNYSFRSARLVMDWFFQNHTAEELHTMHRTDNHAATKMCERLGFEQKYINQEFVILKYRRGLWVSRH